MKKTIISALAFAALSFGVYAAEYTHSLVVNLVSGSTVEYLFADEPTVTFVGDNIAITAGASSMQEPLANVANFTFRAEKSGIAVVSADESHITVAYNGAEIAMTGLGAGSEVSVYSVSGQLCTRAVADDAGSVVVKVDQLTGGVYVASSKEHKFKFIKK